MPDIRIVMTDLDGTFIHNIFEPVQQNVIALRRCQQNGIPVVPVTARNYNCARKMVVKAGFTDYAITNNGSSIQDAKTGENLWANPIPDCWLLSALKLCVDAKAYIDVHDSFHAVHYGPHFEEVSYLEQENEREIDPDFKTNILTLDSPEEIVEFYGGNAQLMRIRFKEDIPSWFYEELIRAGEFQLTSSHTSILEIMSTGSGKRNAVQRLAQMLSIQRENVMACGDQCNDMGMICWAGVGVAMGNAQDAVKRVADFIAPPFDKGGVAYAMEKYVL